MTTTINPKRAMVPLGDAPIQRVDTDALRMAIISALPGGSKMTSDQANGLAIAAQVGDRNPFAREIYMIPGVGAMDASKSVLSDFNEWLESHNDKAEWEYVDVPQSDRDKMRLDPRDTIVEVRLHLKSLRDSWHEKGEALRSWGVPWQEIVKELGAKPPWYTAYGICRFSEQKDDPKTEKYPRTAEQKWADMDAKYSRIERTQKRGRLAIINKICPVTTEQRRRVKEIARAQARALPPNGHEKNQRLLGRNDIESLLDVPASHVDADGVIQEPEAQAHPLIDDVIEADSRPAETRPDEDQSAAEETGQPDPADEEMATEEDAPLRLSDELEAIKSNLDTLADHYAEQQRTVSEKQAKFLFMLVNETCGKDEQKRKMFTLYLAGHDHFPDISHPYLLAIKDSVIKPRPGDDGYSHPDPEAVKLANRIYNEMRAALGQQPLI